jgi:hypothetical protein
MYEGRLNVFKSLKYLVWFGAMAGLGVLLGCYIHASRVNQTTLMSGVDLVREFPFGERIVGAIETTVFSYQEKRNLQQYLDTHKGQIQINPDVLKNHQKLYKEGRGKQ